MLKFDQIYAKYRPRVGKNGVVIFDARVNGNRTTRSFAREIMGCTVNQTVEYNNGDSLDCRVENLLVVDKPSVIDFTLPIGIESVKPSTKFVPPVKPQKTMTIYNEETGEYEEVPCIA